jgi:hypothetical protein
MYTKKVNGCICMFKIKYKSSGIIYKYKAQLVAKFHVGRYGYGKRFSLVANMMIVKTMLAIDQV